MPPLVRPLVRLLGLDKLPNRIVAGIGAILVLSASIVGLTPTVRLLVEEHPITRYLSEKVWLWRVFVMQSDKTNVLVADLEGDDPEKTNTRYLLESLDEQFETYKNSAPIRVQRSLWVLKPPHARNTAVALRRAVDLGRHQLDLLNADLMVWGEVLRLNGKVVRLKLRFLRRSYDEREEANRATPYPLDETLELPERFGQELGLVLASQVAADTAPVLKKAPLAVPLLESKFKKLDKLANHIPKPLDAATRGSILRSYAATAQALGEQKDDAKLLKKAINAYRLALRAEPRKSGALRWASTQNNLGLALWTLGQNRQDATSVKSAISAYRAALEVRTQQDQPLLWAETQNNLGIALWTLGELDQSKPAHVHEAVAIYREVLGTLAPQSDKVSFLWATVQNNLGAALWTLGVRDESPTGTEQLKDSVEAYRQALRQWTREKRPLNWANTQKNIGLALAQLSGRESGTERLRQAVSAYRAALEEMPRVSSGWAETQTNLGIALRLIGAREKGMTRFDEAIRAHRLALTELDRTKAPKLWQENQKNLSYAVLALARRDTDTNHTQAWWAEVLKAQETLAESTEDDEKAQLGKPGPLTAAQLGNAAWYALYARAADKALSLSKRAHTIAPDLLWIESNHAHALLFLGRVADARKLYVAHIGERVAENSDKTWEQVIAEDFANLRKAGLYQKGMTEIEAALGIDAQERSTLTPGDTGGLRE